MVFAVGANHTVWQMSRHGTEYSRLSKATWPSPAHAAANVLAQIRGRRLRSFRFAYMARFISIGRRDALAQFTRFRLSDSPRRVVLTGRIAAWMEELTFQFNVFALKTGFYPWRS